MSTRRNIAIIAGLLSTALLVIGLTSCFTTNDLVYHPPCEHEDGGTDGGGGNGGNCP